MAQLGAEHGNALRDVRAIGLSGQMHGAVLLDDAGPRAAAGDPVERRPQR